MTIDTQIAETIIQQAGQFALISVGAHNFEPIDQGVRFNIHITPRPEGKRPEIMTAEITLEPTDLYKITITKTDLQTPGEIVTYFDMAELFFDQLATVLTAVERGKLYGHKTTAQIES